MIDDARVVLPFCGYTNERGDWWAHPDGDIRNVSGDVRYEKEFWLDANWIHGTLIPALATLFPPKWGIDVFHGWDGAPVLVYFFGVGVETLRGTGPTFEAAMISAAAKAVRDAER